MYNGIVYMDFERELVESTGHGRYERMYPSATGFDPAALNIYVAYDPNRAEESGKAHKKVKSLFERKNTDVMAAMTEFAEIARRGRDAMLAGDAAALHALVDANFDLRAKIFDIAPENKRMVATARSAGASAKFAGSGGAIVGTYADEKQFAVLEAALAGIGCKTLRPRIALEADESADLTATGWRNS